MHGASAVARERPEPPEGGSEEAARCGKVASEMPTGYPRTSCKSCGRSLAEVGSLSKRGLCQDCGEGHRNANLVCLVTHQGPYFDHWRRRSLAALGVFALDEPESGR